MSIDVLIFQLILIKIFFFVFNMQQLENMLIRLYLISQFGNFIIIFNHSKS
jgi:hypothetical protein